MPIEGFRLRVNIYQAGSEDKPNPKEEDLVVGINIVSAEGSIDEKRVRTLINRSYRGEESKEMVLGVVDQVFSLVDEGVNTQDKSSVMRAQKENLVMDAGSKILQYIQEESANGKMTLAGALSSFQEVREALEFLKNTQTFGVRKNLRDILCILCPNLSTVIRV